MLCLCLGRDSGLSPPPLPLETGPPPQTPERERERRVADGDGKMEGRRTKGREGGRREERKVVKITLSLSGLHHHTYMYTHCAGNRKKTVAFFLSPRGSSHK